MSGEWTFKQRERERGDGKAMEQPMWILRGRTIQADERAKAKVLR